MRVGKVCDTVRLRGVSVGVSPPGLGGGCAQGLCGERGSGEGVALRVYRDYCDRGSQPP